MNFINEFFKRAGFIFFTLLIIWSFASLFLIFSNNEKIDEYEQQKKFIVNTSKDLIAKISELQNKVDDYNKDKKILEQTIKQREEEIKRLENSFIVNGDLFIPDDYNLLKINYIALFNAYNTQKNINGLLKDQVDKDGKIILDLNTTLDDTKNKLNDAIYLLENQPKKPFIQHGVIGGVSLNFENKKSYHLGYVGVIKDKIIIETTISYPLCVSIFGGVIF
jgi:hypothetical protein